MLLVGLHVQHLSRRGLADGTIAKRRRRLILFDEQVGLERATPEDVERFLDGRNLATKTRYDWVSDLHGFYRWAVDWGHLDEDPTVRVVRPKLPRRLPRPIGAGDLATALAMANPTMRAWLTLMAFGGFRCVEVARLSVDCILWDDGLLRIVGKGDTERMVPMHPEVRRVLRLTPLPSRGPVFRRPRGGPYPPAQVSRETSLFLASYGIGATAHQLRHFFGTHVYRTSGRDLRVTQELMGHASPTTTAMYADWSRPEARTAVEALSVETEPSVLSEWAS